MIESVVTSTWKWQSIEESKRSVAWKPDNDLVRVWTSAVIAQRGPLEYWMVAGPVRRYVEYAEWV